METSIILKRQTSLLKRLKDHIDLTGYRPVRSSKFRGLKKISELRRNPDEILIPELKELIMSEKYSGGPSNKSTSIKNKINEILRFIEQYDRFPKSGSKDSKERYLRESCQQIEVRTDPRILEKLRYYFISKLLSAEDCYSVCYQFIKSNNRWPKQGADDIERNIHYYLKIHIDEFRARYSDFCKLEETLRPTKTRRLKSSNHVDFYRDWCKEHNSYPCWKFREDKDYSKVNMIKVRAYSSTPVATLLKKGIGYRLTDREKAEVRKISEKYGYVFISKPKTKVEKPLQAQIEQKENKNKVYNKESRVYQTYLNSWDGIKSEAQIYRELALQFDTSIDTIKRYIQICKKSDMTYNKNHALMKDRFNRSILNYIGRSNIKSILDPFAGEKSFYLDKKRIKVPVNILTTEVITNDIKFKGHTFNADARDVLDHFIKTGKTFDIVDLDPFDQPLYYISLINLIEMTNKAFILTLGCMDRTKTTKAIRGIWDIQFSKDIEPINQISQKISEVAKKYCKKNVKFLKGHRYQGGTYRLAYIIEEEG